MEFTVGQVGIGTLLRRTKTPCDDSVHGWVFNALMGHEIIVTRYPRPGEIVVEVISRPHGAGFDPSRGFVVPEAYFTSDYFEVLDPKTKEPIPLKVLQTR